MTYCNRLRSSLLAGLALVAACGPKNPGADEGGPGDTDQATAADSEPTGSVPTEDEPTGNSPAESCGPCHTIFGGDVSPSGVTEIDGFMVAVDQLRNAVATVQGAFIADIRILAATYGLAAAEVNQDFVSELIAAIQADFAAHTQSVRIVHVPGRCSSDIDIAVAAQQRCELGNNCDVAAFPERPAVQCEGTCVGACSGNCSGDLSCVVSAPGVACDGRCDGVCTSAGAPCEGTCRGSCDGECSQVDSNGDCAGGCDGKCQGSCGDAVPAECAGQCSGLCRLDQGSVMCTAEATCRGQCAGECAGECLGVVRPPSASPDCAAAAGCQAQAAAQGSASVGCTPPVLDLQFEFEEGLGSTARGAFAARTRVLQIHGTAILQGAAQLGALVNGQVNGELVFNPPPLVSLTVQLQTLLQNGFHDWPIPSGRLACVEPAVQAGIEALAGVAGSSAAIIESQALLAAFITTGG